MLCACHLISRMSSFVINVDIVFTSTCPSITTSLLVHVYLMYYFCSKYSSYIDKLSPRFIKCGYCRITIIVAHPNVA